MAGASAVQVLTYEVQESILGTLRMGNYRQVAARIAGVHPKNLERWIKAGEDICEHEPDIEALPEEDRLLAVFYLKVVKAEAEAEATLVRRWRKRTSEDWRASAGFLKSRYNDRWNEKQELTLSGGLENTGTVDLTKLGTDDLGHLAELLKKAGQSG